MSFKCEYYIHVILASFVVKVIDTLEVPATLFLDINSTLIL